MDRKHHGHEVEMVCDGDKGTESIESGYRSDLVIIDSTMPRVNGDAVEREQFGSVVGKPFKRNVLFGTVRTLFEDP
jgi:DNA-binding NtrC family response regulator